MPTLQDSRRRAPRARVLLADDHALFAGTLELLLAAELPLTARWAS